MKRISIECDCGYTRTEIDLKAWKLLSSEAKSKLIDEFICEKCYLDFPTKVIKITGR